MHYLTKSYQELCKIDTSITFILQIGRNRHREVTSIDRIQMQQYYHFMCATIRKALGSTVLWQCATAASSEGTGLRKVGWIYWSSGVTGDKAVLVAR